MMKIAASILNCNFLKLEEEIRKVQENGVDAIHLDVMDGHFVSNLSFGTPILQAIKPIVWVPIISHLMVLEPEKMISNFISESDGIVFHIEATQKVSKCLQLIEEASKLKGIAINPNTKIDAISPYLDKLDEVLIMSVHPGFGGQSFISESLNKISNLKEMIKANHYKTLIGVDGGVGLNNAKSILEAGADILVVGSGIFKSKNYSETIRKLKCLK